MVSWDRIQCPKCKNTEARHYHTGRKYCGKCDWRGDPEAPRELPPVCLVYCGKCACYYTQFCPAHDYGDIEDAPQTARMFPRF